MTKSPTDASTVDTASAISDTPWSCTWETSFAVERVNEFNVNEIHSLMWMRFIVVSGRFVLVID